MSVVLWSGKTFQDQYVLKTLPQINRNPIGLKIFARLDYAGKYFPKGFKPHEELKRYIDLATDRPGEEIEILSHKGEEYLAICFNGAMLSRYKLLGLYPLARLDRLIGRHKNDLIMLGVLSILLGLWLAQILAKGFLVPLDRLQSAALAIEQRKFDHQLEVKNKDEFGDIANVFQNVMHDLQELEVAKVVQEGLFPDRGRKQNRVNIFGRSVAMAELGGDYLDFFAISDEECGVLLGDVAGHGVGAALIMAMAKSGILSSQDHLSQPKKLLENLHKLILSSKTRKQRKIMTFQYLCINSNSGMVRYANAGGCSPLIVKNKGQSIKELTLAGAALGAFKKAKFNEIEFSLESGDAIVFYTDGIIEAHDPTGVEMGYERFAQLVKESWHANPETYYQRLYQEYLQHTGHQDAEDDLTLIVTNYI